MIGVGAIRFREHQWNYSVSDSPRSESCLIESSHHIKYARSHKYDYAKQKEAPSTTAVNG